MALFAQWALFVQMTNLPYEPKDVVSLYNAAKDGWGSRPTPDHELVLIKLGAYTGARIEELCSLKVSNIKKDAFYIGDSKTAAGTASKSWLTQKWTKLMRL